MKEIKVDQVKCIGCGACVGLDPEHFDFDDSGLSTVINQENLESEDLAQAVSGCPTGAISIDGDEKTTVEEVTPENEEN